MTDFWRHGGTRSSSSSSSASRPTARFGEAREEEDIDTEPNAIGMEEESSREGEKPLAVFNPNGSLSISLQRARLPIHEYRRDFLFLVENFQTVIVVGQTGCGKTTRQSLINHQSSTINHQSSIINHQSSIINHQSSIINHQPSTINHQPSIINHQSP